MNKKYIAVLAGTGLIASLALALPAFAQTQTTGVSVGASVQGTFHGGPGPARVPGIFGTVASISGDSLTVDSKAFGNNSSTAAGTVYTVDATNAKIYKNSTSTTSIASIATGDTVMVQGTITGTNVVATTIRDGVMGGMTGTFMGGKGMGHSTSTRNGSSTMPVITGNGEPVIGGSVTAISGDSVTVTTKTNIVYAVDVSSSTIIKNGTSTAIGNIATGDTVIVQGTVNGTAVTASSFIDQGAAANASSTKGGSRPVVGGILGMIGGFFQHLFGF